MFLQLALVPCLNHLKKYCSDRIGRNASKQRHCFEQLIAARSAQSASKVQAPFRQFEACMKQRRSDVMKKCVPTLDRACHKKRLVVVKTVRMEMETALELMEKYPNNLQIIHLIRDPKSVVLSRMKATWALHGTTNPKRAKSELLQVQKLISSPLHVNNSVMFEDYSVNREILSGPKPQNDIALEAHMYCALVRKDVITRRYIERKYPGRTYQMIYDEMVNHPLHELERIYSFIGEKIPSGIHSWVASLNSGGSGKTSQSHANKWKNAMSDSSAQLIDSFCEILYDTVTEYQWPRA